jgi:2-dehydro-3-deoxygluconokinase
VTPAISASAAEATLEAVSAARLRGVTVSCDYNYRKNLWKYGKSAPEVMREIVGKANVGIANEEDCEKALGIASDVDVSRASSSTTGIEELLSQCSTHFQIWRSRLLRCVKVTAPTATDGRL